MILILVACLAFARILDRGPPRLASGDTVVHTSTGYLTIMDAGSSGCRAHVFRWSRSSDGTVVVDPKHESLKVRPGLSSFANEPDKAGASLVGLLEFMATKIPEEERAATPVVFRATAGLRLLPPEQSDAILNSVREALSKSEYSFDQDEGVKVIAGTDEGGYGWMSVNYLLHNFDKAADFTGVIEMGGASAQVTQIVANSPGSLRGTNAVPPGSKFAFSLGSSKYELYAQSYLGYGLEAARQTTTAYLVDNQLAADDPCLNLGFVASADEPRQSVYDGAPGVEVRGSGNFNKCREVIQAALFPTRPPADCKHASCSNIQSAFQPTSLPESKFLVFENFYYTASMLGIDMPQASPQVFRFEARDHACSLPWDQLVAEYPKDGSPKEFVSKLCFSATYLDLFLERGLGLKANKNIVIQQDVNGDDIDWSLGAAIHEANKFAVVSANKLH